MLFSEVFGHDELKKKLISSVKNGRLAHALLFFGLTGFGSLALAIAYAQYIVCLNKNEADSCGHCANCQKITKLTHPDLHFSYPVNTTGKIAKDPVSENFISDWREFVNANPYFSVNQWYETIGIENKQGIINKKESEEIIKKLRFKSFESEYKFMIIWLPEKMNATAANVLLKLIEEPPDKTIFLLVSEQPEHLLSTIRSRVQPVKVDRIDDTSFARALESKYDLPKEKISDIIRLSGGNLCKAQEIILSSDENTFHLEQFAQIMRLCYKRDYFNINTWVEEMAAIGREKIKSFLQYSLKLVRENFILNLKNTELNYLAAAELDFSKKFHPFINENNVIKVYEELNKAFSDIERNAYAKIVLFDLSLHFMKLIPNRLK